MNFFEAYQAMKAGKIVVSSEGYRYRLSPKYPHFIECCPFDVDEWHTTFNSTTELIENCPPFTLFSPPPLPLTFLQALEKVAEGKTIECLEDGARMFIDGPDDWAEICLADFHHQWVVVEDDSGD